MIIENKKKKSLFNSYKFDYVEVLYVLLAVATFIISLRRCFFGVEFTDEAYYVSDALAVMHGNIPYALNMSTVSGMSFIPIIFYKIYYLLDIEFIGIFLYSRICFLIFRTIIIIAIYFITKKFLDRKKRLLIVCFLLSLQGSFSSQNFSYNSISFYLSMFVSVCLYILSKTNKSYGYFICGFIIAFAVFAHPAYIFSVFSFIFLIFVNSKVNKIKNILLFCFGGIISILIVFVPIISNYGMNMLISGFDVIINYGQKTNTSSIIERVLEVLRFIYPLLKQFIMSILIIFVLFKTVFKKCIGISQDVYVISINLICIFVSIFTTIIDEINVYSSVKLGAICFVTWFLLLPIYKREIVIWYFSSYSAVFILFMTLFTLTGVTRFYQFIIVLLGICLANENNKNKYIGTTSSILLIIFTILLTIINCTFVYRDEKIQYLDTVVQEGAYKGIYTTKTKAKDIVELNEYLNTNIDVNELISIRDNAPVGYLLLCKNEICDVRTWDEMQYSYGCNEPTSMFMYYKNKQQIPDVIIYIDFDKDNGLSIENEDAGFKYNLFVNDYYYLDSEFSNKTFERVLIYRNNNKFNGNFDSLIKYY